MTDKHFIFMKSTQIKVSRWTSWFIQFLFFWSLIRGLLLIWLFPSITMSIWYLSPFLKWYQCSLSRQQVLDLKSHFYFWLWGLWGHHRLSTYCNIFAISTALIFQGDLREIHNRSHPDKQLCCRLLLKSPIGYWQWRVDCSLWWFGFGS